MDELRLLTQHVVAQVAAYADAQLSGTCASLFAAIRPSVMGFPRTIPAACAYPLTRVSGSLESMELLQHIVLMIDRKYTQMQHEVARVGRLSAVMIAKGMSHLHDAL